MEFMGDQGKCGRNILINYDTSPAPNEQSMEGIKLVSGTVVNDVTHVIHVTYHRDESLFNLLKNVSVCRGKRYQYCYSPLLPL